MADKIELSTDLRRPSGGLLKSLDKLSWAEIRALQNHVDRHLEAMDRHFEEVAKPNATHMCPNCHGQGSKTTVVRMRVECDACGGGGVMRED